MIVTDLPILKEMKVKNGDNGFILNFDLSNLDEVIDNMYNNDLKGFNYKVNQSDKIYQEILGKETIKTYKYNPNQIVKDDDNYICLTRVKVNNKTYEEGETFTSRYNQHIMLLMQNKLIKRSE